MTPAIEKAKAALPSVIEREWQNILDKDDRNSPEEYPEMVMITYDELAQAMRAALEAESAGDERREPFKVLPGTYSWQPEQPTEEMLNEARDWSYKKYGKPIGNDAAIGCWQVMYRAFMPDPIPQPPRAGED
jgi:hypothetical protein